ncbi:MAG: NADH-quinone oxidoreductase subunit L [Denitrobacterium detoxificans]|nr:NADH-quinone oxidoreductase subunit L [Denitrobacterium detoxificans]
MEMIGFLILFPLVIAAVLLFIKNNSVRTAIVCSAAAIIALATLVFCATNIATPGVYIEFSSQIIDYICALASILIGVCVIAFAIRYKNVWAGILAGVQLVASLVFEFAFAHGIHVTYGLYFDSLSVAMAFIIGIIGTGICVYALGYMEDFQREHADEKDRRPVFFAIMFLFLSAMYAVVFSNNMSWLFTAWEITTVCSFLLIGYTRTDEAIRNAFRQIIMNIAGGLGFSVALYFCAIALKTLSFYEFIALGAYTPALVVLPASALAFAGLTKAAQMPFHTWLLGAMVAPTPTSALLHSSTMVKAGVFMLVKLAPVFVVSMVPSMMVILVGGITFMLASFMAISQSNAKRVLAYSTIANLGLIVACAGVGTPEAIWAAIFLILFHAIAKSLLFLCVGTAEHHIGSRNIEDMDLLFERMPKLARLMMLGIMTMFIAPFGMLISKWATLVSLVEMNQVVLLVLLAFGSAATFMFWAKWLGKLSGIAAAQESVEVTVTKTEWVSLYLMAALIVLCCFFLPVISNYVVLPYIATVYANPTAALSDDILWITSILAVVVTLLLFVGLNRKAPKGKKASVYLAGVSADNANRVYVNAMSQRSEATVRNWYLESLFGESRIKPIGEISCTLIIIAAFAMSLASITAVF